MAMLQIIPNFAISTNYYDNVYYLILFVLLSFLGVSIPFVTPNLPKYMKIISNLLGGWFIAMLFFEILNLFTPETVLNSNHDLRLYTKFLMMFVIGTAFAIVNNTWTKSTLEK